jgi:hypothetical protein
MFGSNLNLLFYFCFLNVIIKFSTNPNLTHVKKLLYIYIYIYLSISFHPNGRFSSFFVFNNLNLN